MYPERGAYFLVYQGPSMNPIFRNSDLLYVTPYTAKPQRGDIVAFISRIDKKKTAHRVVAIDGDIITTRGDNNDQPDPFFMRPEEIIGRIDYLKRGSAFMPVHGGKAGLAQSHFFRFRRRFLEAIYLILGPAYRAIAKTGIIRRLASSLIKTRILYFDRHGGREYQFIVGGRVVAKRYPQGEWLIKRPFRLFIDTEAVK